jgi:hypothetical protein
VDYRTMFESDYLTATEFKGRTPTFTITGVALKKLPNPETGEERTKGVIAFREVPKGWVMNRTNAQCLAAMFGGDTEAWVGKRVTLHAVEVQVGPKKDMGIRVVGSPDIEKPVVATIVLPRKKPRPMTLAPTGKGVAPAANAAREPGSEG